MAILVQGCCYVTILGFVLMTMANIATGDLASAVGCAQAASIFTAAFHV